MDMDIQKKQMQEVALLYYEKNLTQSEIAKIMNLSRQTVSKLLGDAIKEKIVEIKIHDPEITCADLEKEICGKFGIKNARLPCGEDARSGSRLTWQPWQQPAGPAGSPGCPPG